MLNQRTNHHRETSVCVRCGNYPELDYDDALGYMFFCRCSDSACVLSSTLTSAIDLWNDLNEDTIDD